MASSREQALKNPAFLKTMGKGREKGSKNKFTSLKLSFLEAFEELGGTDGLVKWAKKNPNKYYELVARLLPQENTQAGNIVIVNHIPGLSITNTNGADNKDRDLSPQPETVGSPPVPG